MSDVGVGVGDVAADELQRAIVTIARTDEHLGGWGGNRTAGCDLQRASLHHGGTGVGVGAIKDEGAGALFDDGAGAADSARETRGAGLVDDEVGIAQVHRSSRAT